MGHRRKSRHHQVNESDDEKYPAVQTKGTHRKLKRSICLPRDASSESYRDADCKRKKRHKRKKNKHHGGTGKKHRERHRAYDSQSLSKVKHAERSHARAKARKRSRHQSDSDSCSSESSSSYSNRSRTRSEMTKRARLQQHDYAHDCRTTETNTLKEIAGSKVTAISRGSDIKEEDQCCTSQNNLKRRPDFQRYKCQDEPKDKSLKEVPKSKENLDDKSLLQSSVLARRELKPGSGNTADKTVGGEATGLGSEGSGLDFLERQLRKHALANYMRYLGSTDGQKGGLPKDHSNQDREPFELKHDVTDTHMGALVEQVSDLDNRNIVALRNSEMDICYPVCPVADSPLQETKVEEEQWPLRDELGLQIGSMETQAASTADQIAARNEGAKIEDAERLHRQTKAKFHDGKRCINFATEGLNVEELKSVNTPQVTDLTSLSSVSKSATHVSAEENAQAEKRSNEMEKISVEDLSVIAESTHPPVERHSKSQQNDASMFQQKTMSVMRGGEMVQVNYKVYIPQRAKERAKKRLQR